MDLITFLFSMKTRLYYDENLSMNELEIEFIYENWHKSCFTVSNIC